MPDNTLRFRTVVDDRASGPLDRLRTKFDQLGGKGSAASFFGNVTALGFAKGLDLIAGAAGSAIDFVQGSTTAASDLNETISKGRVIFGENADDMEAWAGTAASSFGQSKRAALDVASTFAGLFDTAGIALDDATDKSRKLTELGSDLASFFNADVNDALEALRSGLSGESEPLRRFNVFLSETAVNAKLIEDGQEKVNGQWTEGQKIAARYKIILEQTAKAQGDFARTSDGLANSQRTADATLEDLQATLGQRFLPVARQVTQWQIDFLEGAELVNDFFTTNADEAATQAKALATAVDLLGGASGRLNGRFVTAQGLAIELQREWAASAQAAEDYGVAMGDTADEVRVSAADLSGAAIQVGDDTEAMTEAAIAALEEYENEWDRVRGILTGSAGAFADALWDPIILKTEIAANEHEQAELRKVRASKDASAEEKRDAEQRINELQKHRIEMLAELASYGDTSAKTTLENELKIFETTRTLTAEQKDLLAQLRAALGLVRDAWYGVYRAAVAATNVNPYVGDFGYGRAAGGPVKANTAYIVGEKGPELFVPGSTGTIIPAAESSGPVSWGGAGGRSMRPIMVYLDGREVGRGVIDPLDDEMYWRIAAAGGATIEG